MMIIIIVVVIIIIIIYAVRDSIFNLRSCALALSDDFFCMLLIQRIFHSVFRIPG